MAQSILDEHSLLTREAMIALSEKSSTLKCECPKHLIKLLKEIRLFQDYELSCMTATDKDRETHAWLHASAVNIDQMLSGTIAQLARLEGMIDEENLIVAHPASS